MNKGLRIAIIAATGLCVLTPLLLVAWQSLLSGPFFARNVHVTLDAFRFVFSDPSFYAALGNTLLIAAGMALVAVPVGSALAFLLARANLPGARWIEPLILAPMFISSIVLAFGFVVTLGPVGFVSLWAKELFGAVPWTLYSRTSLIVLAGLAHAPHVFLYVSSALRGLGADMEEAARISGAGPMRVALTISLPVVWPSILYAAVLVFFLGFELFGLPLILTDPEGVQVLATYLYGLTNILGAPSYQLMAVVVIVIVAMAAPLVFVQQRLLRDADRYISVRGKAQRSRPLDIGVWRWPALAFVIGWLALTVVVPVCGLVVRAFVSRWGEGVSLVDAFTLENFHELLATPNILRGVLNTALVALIGGAASVGVYAAIVLAAHRWRSRWSSALNYLMLLPRAMPGIVAGLAIFWVFLFAPPLQPLRHTLVAVWFAYTLVWMAYGAQLISASLLQIAPELEEAGRVSGASPGRVTCDITLPLIRTGLIAAWVLIFITFAREYSTGVYLLSPGSEVIGSLLVSLWGAGSVDVVAALASLNIAIVGAGLLALAAARKPAA